jgi:HPt (histidine-containing phosphotransfer) domain-containing protein
MNLEPPGSGASTDVSAPPAALDAAALARLRELDPDGRQGLLARVLAAYESSLRGMIDQLHAALDAGDAGAVAGLAHKLKSSSASVGALALAASCADVERRLRGGVPGDLAADVARLRADGEAALRAVGAMLRP